MANERKARELADLRQEKSRDARLAKQQQARMEDVFSQVGEGRVLGSSSKPPSAST